MIPELSTYSVEAFCKNMPHRFLNFIELFTYIIMGCTLVLLIIRLIDISTNKMSPCASSSWILEIVCVHCSIQQSWVIAAEWDLRSALPLLGLNFFLSLMCTLLHPIVRHYCSRVVVVQLTNNHLAFANRTLKLYNASMHHHINLKLVPVQSQSWEDTHSLFMWFQAIKFLYLQLQIQISNTWVQKKMAFFVLLFDSHV